MDLSIHRVKDVTFKKSHTLTDGTYTYDIIITSLMYIDEKEREVAFELSLFSDELLGVTYE